MIHGTIISGTHRVVDLVPVFLTVLHHLDADAATKIRFEYSDALDAIDAHTGPLDVDLGEDGAFLVDHLMNCLDACAPDGYYFGAHPGDGADFGFWPVDDDDYVDDYVDDYEDDDDDVFALLESFGEVDDTMTEPF